MASVNALSHWGCTLVAVSLCAAPLAGQRSQILLEPLDRLRATDATAGSPAERTYQLLALLSDARVSNTLLPFDGPTLDSIARAAGAPAWGTRRGIVPASLWLGSWWNSARPRSDQDGPVWQGRGVTVAGGLGLTVRYPGVDFSFQPLAWVSQNAPYTPSGASPIAEDDFRNPFQPLIDTPYRFGDKAVGRLEPGESWLRLGAGGATFGFTTASQRWGPAFYYPLMMSTESAGYPRLFAEARAVNLGIFRATANWSLGRLESSGFTILPSGGRSRIVPSLVMSVRPNWFPGLEVGGTRLFHLRWTRSDATVRTALLPFKGFLKENDPTGEARSAAQNQMASAFFEASGRGVEVYGEFLREDHSWDQRDLTGEPDHASAYTIGLRRAIKRSGTNRTLIVFETANGRISHLTRVRFQVAPHIHTPMMEGHSFRGQPLGSSAIIGGGGVTFGLHQVGARNASSFEGEMRRTAQNGEGGTWNGEMVGTYNLRYSRSRLDDLGKKRTFHLALEKNFGAGGPLSVAIGFGITLDARSPAAR